MCNKFQCEYLVNYADKDTQELGDYDDQDWYCMKFNREITPKYYDVECDDFNK